MTRGLGRVVAIVLCGALASVSAVVANTAQSAEALTGGPPRYPYGSAVFSGFVADSYDEERSSAGVEPFASWLEATYARTPRAWLGGADGLTLKQALARRRSDLRALHDSPRRTRLELETGAWLHRAIKAMIPRFSLHRGFEFVNTVRFGERQCLLQSVLIAGLLQAVDIEAGVYMVWKNQEGKESNNGHAVTVMKLSDGRDVLVDASDPTPFMRHRGVFGVDRNGPNYRFVQPQYDSDGVIARYRTAAGDRVLSSAQVRPLDATFLRSQFYYYRGEHAAGGYLGRPPTSQGLAASARWLERAERISPQNPLAVYVLGLVYAKQRRVAAAKAQYSTGYNLYASFGYVPPGPRNAYHQSSP